MKIVAGVALASAALTTACSTPSAGIGPPHPCPALALVAPQLLYPIPGATGVPTVAWSLVVAGSLPSSIAVELVAQGGVTLDLGPLRAPPSPLPSPEATPTNPMATLNGVAYPALEPATTYSVAYHDTAKVCPIPVGGNTGSFTTQ